MIDLPQVVDLFANPRGHDLPARDAAVVCDWFTALGPPGADPDELTTILLADTGCAEPPPVPQARQPSA